MQELSKFRSKVEFLFTDIDDTLTDEGQLGPEAYQALWDLKAQGLKVIPVTGRPAGWCEMIARLWPVEGVIGENGGFYFRYHEKKMLRHFALPKEERELNRKRLNDLQEKILTAVPGADLASDQFCRMMDLAIDFCEDVKPLATQEISKIVKIFNEAGAQAKVSSIHVNGWFGKYDKLTMTKVFLKNEFAIPEEKIKSTSAFVGDSPNDEPMFNYFDHSFGVANVENFKSQIQHLPKYISPSRGGKGFAEIAKQILSLKKNGAKN